MPEKRKFSDYFYNTVSYIGAVLAVFFILIEGFLFALDFISKESNIYLGILTYVILPVFLILGLVMIPIGAFWKKRRIDRGLSEFSRKQFHFDLSRPTHRNALAVFIIGTLFLIIMTAVGTYKAYQYTESVAFCGLTCHKVMSPQHTAYLNSPHARVKCVECHIGEGANWYAYYKMAGVRQMFHFMKGDYPRPIPTPVENLRPASETCERCHWPDKFYSSLEINRAYYSADEQEPKKWILRMLVHVGNKKGESAGIHSHMYLDHDIFYAAEDKERQVISWVKSVAKDGTQTVYTSADSKYKDSLPPEEAIRKMDCIDCHNRPTHQFNAPYELVNSALNNNSISSDIPNVKSKVMEVLSATYPSLEKAVEEIKANITAYYQAEHADYYRENKGKIDQAINQAVFLYQNNFFPEMKTSWYNRPDNIGHLWTQGCFRCHDGSHESQDGKVISKDCTSCHTIIEQGPVGDVQSSVSGLEFVHPFEDDGLWKDMDCSSCHTGN